MKSEDDIVDDWYDASDIEQYEKGSFIHDERGYI